MKIHPSENVAQWFFVGLKNGKKCIENQTSIQKLSITLFSIHFEKSAPAVYKAGKWDCKLKN